jgi:hypothetical protein
MRFLSLLTLLLLATAQPVAAKPTAAGANAFLTVLYRPYRTSGMNASEPLEKPASYFEAKLAAAISADSRDAAKRGEVPNLDGDPICDCQDYEPFKAVIGIISVKGNRAEADVRFTNFEEKRLHYRLIATSKGWRIYDIVLPDGHSLRGMFKP